MFTFMTAREKEIDDERTRGQRESEDKQRKRER